MKRLLGRCPCSYSKRFGRGSSRNRTGQVLGADAWRRKHHRACDECRLRERREQQYLERLRRAAVPAASDDLTARLLARTGELARAADPAEGHPDADPPAAVHGARPGAGQPWGPSSGDGRRRTRVAALATGGAAAAMALMAGSAYLMGENPVPLAAGEASTAFLEKDLAVSAAAVAPDAGAASGWGLPGEPHISPADALSAEQLIALRAQGWTCPELGNLGFHLVWARGGVVAGSDVVELRLTDGRHFATVLEQHASLTPHQGGSGLQQTAAGPPMNVLTGHPAGADGFTAAAPSGTLRPADGPHGTPLGGGAGGLWVNPAPPFRAIVQGSAGTFTYVSDQPAEEAGRGLAALVRTSAVPRTEAQTEVRSTQGQAAAAGIQIRLERGLGRILELLAP